MQPSRRRRVTLPLAVALLLAGVSGAAVASGRRPSTPFLATVDFPAAEQR